MAKPIIINNPDTGESYTLEFNRASVEWAEQRGFNIADLGNGKILSGISDLFYYSFRMHHPYMTKTQTDTILFDKEKGFGGVPDGLAERLGELFAEPYNALVQSEENAKNSKWSVEL